jgi:hypothetical protein
MRTDEAANSAVGMVRSRGVGNAMLTAVEATYFTPAKERHIKQFAMKKGKETGDFAQYRSRVIVPRHPWRGLL